MRTLHRLRFLFLALAFLFLLHAIGWLRPVEQGMSAVLRPVETLLSRLAPTAESRQETRRQNERIRELEAQVSRLMTENVLLKEDRRRGNAETVQQNFLASRALHGITTTVVGRSPEGDVQILVLDRGSEKGIAAGLPVITENGILVGTVQEASPGRSTALLLTDTQSSVAAEIGNQRHSPGLVQGQHGLTMIMRFIPQNEAIEKDQAVVTSAVDERIPANLTLGTVSGVHATTGNLFQEATLLPLIDFQRMRYVTVILP